MTKRQPVPRDWSIFLSTILLGFLITSPTVSMATRSDFKNTCDVDFDESATCLSDRSSVGPIKAIVHGTKNDPFWQQIKKGMEQTALDMKIDLELILYDDEDPNLDASTLGDAMVKTIKQYEAYTHEGRRLTGLMGGSEDSPSDVPPRPAAMIVSLPGNPEIENALKDMQRSNIPIFGINAITKNGENNEFLRGTISMDDSQAGILAGTHMRELLQESDKAGPISGIYINHRSDVVSLQKRFDALKEATIDVVDSWEVGYLEKDTSEDEFLAFFEGCKHTVIQLAGGSGIAEAVLQALVANGCNIEENHVVGTFDTSSRFIYDAISQGSIKFAISQQPYLQGSHAVLMAALYATTGQLLHADDGIPHVDTGPILVTAESADFFLKDRQICEQEGYPVCSPGTGASAHYECPCTERSRLSIAVLTHDDDESLDFWSPVFSGISQAADDFGVKIRKNALRKTGPPSNHGRRGGHKKSRLKHSFDINEACHSKSINGLIVSLPDSTMMDGLAVCDSRNIPYIVMNAMGGVNVDDIEPEGSQQLRYVGQRDYESGLEAGRRLIEAGVLQGWCLVHANYDTLRERCRGMEAAFLDNEKAKYMGVIQVPNNKDIDIYKQAVEAAMEKDGDWIAHGVLSTGRGQIPGLLSLLDDHAEMLAGTFDLDASLYKGLSNQIVFGIDQSAFLEGYISVASMVWKISTMETPTTAILETGPKFVSSPSNGDEKYEECRDKSIQLCQSKPEKTSSSSSSSATTAPLPVIDEHPLSYTGKCSALGRKCGVCEGDCNDDTDCGEGLVCFIRDSLTSGTSDPVPGCNTNPYEWGAKDFCVDARVYQCKDADQIDVKVGSFSVKHTCSYVAQDKDNRCKQYGRLCRETCGYCRSEATKVDTAY